MSNIREIDAMIIRISAKIVELENALNGQNIALAQHTQTIAILKKENERLRNELNGGTSSESAERGQPEHSDASGHNSNGSDRDRGDVVRAEVAK